MRRDKKAKILLVDDDKISLKIYKSYLSGPEYEVTTATSAIDGLRILNTYQPDIILSDFVMEKMNGIEFCHEVKNRKDMQNVIFILMSAERVESKDTIQALEEGADDFLLKSTEKPEFIAKVNAFLRIKFLQDDILKNNNILEKTVKALDNSKIELEKKNQELIDEKERLNTSFKQILLMSKELEEKNEILHKSNIDRENKFQSIIKLISTLLESRRQFHRGHAKEVGEIAMYLAKKIGLSEYEVNAINTASLLHEIGKFGIPDNLALKNPSDYTQDEKMLLQRHPIVGASMLEEYFGSNSIIIKMIRHHYEKVDGTGTPDKLKLNDIPIGSRIIAIANKFDNLFNRAEDGKAGSALDAMENLAGSVYDPNIIKYLREYIIEHNLEHVENIEKTMIYELNPGMELATDIYTKNGLKLFSKNTILDEHSISNIIKYDKIDPIVDDIYIKI